MQRYTPTIHWHTELHGQRPEPAMSEDAAGGYYHRDDVIKLQQRLVACEAALMMLAARSIPDTVEYMAKWPEPYEAK